MSRTKRTIPYWVAGYFSRDPERKQFHIRDELFNGYDDHSHSALKVNISGWPEDFHSSPGRVFYKRKMSKYRRNVGKREIDSQLFD